MTDGSAIIVAAYSARALASCARHAGFTPLSIDVFGDDDTRAISLASVKLEGGLSHGVAPDKIRRAVDGLIDAYAPIGLVYGAGFEHQPETIAAIAETIRVFGNGPGVLGRAKDPFAFARLCEANWVRHPAIALDSPDEPRQWLIKKRGGAGGVHVAAAGAAGRAGPNSYFQRLVGGKSISALFLASKGQADIVGLSVQWPAPTRSSPFRYGGAAGPFAIDPVKANEIARAVAVMTLELNLIGLNSADFLVSEDAVWLIEINPRPGATLDVFESNEAPLFARHIAACEGRPTTAFPSLGFKAAEIVYAPHDLVIRSQADWPDWAADRSPAGTRVSAGDPLCTTLGSGASVEAAQASAAERARTIIALIEETNR